MTFAPEIAAKVFRGNTVEAEHHTSIAVVDKNGRLTHYLGNPEMMIMTRSSIKMFQVMPLLVSGAADYFKFTDKQIAIMCGSHNGSDEHRDVVLSNLEVAGNSSEDLQCGCHWPIGMSDALIFPNNGEEKDTVRHNCSGKHSGFLALSKFLGEDIEEYLNPESKTQQMVKKAVAEYCEYPEDKMDVTIDGCSAPNLSLPLKNLALGFMKLASCRGSENIGSDTVSRIRNAVYKHPEMVSGEGRLDLAFAKSFPGNIINKYGAETIEGVGFAKPQIGIAVKVHDGHARSLGPILVEVLRQLGLIDNPEKHPYLIKYWEPVILNVRNLVTGYIKAEFKLKKVTN